MIKHTIEELEKIHADAKYGYENFGHPHFKLTMELAQELIDVQKRFRQELPEFLAWREDELCDRFNEDTDLSEYWDNYINGFFV